MPSLNDGQGSVRRDVWSDVPVFGGRPAQALERVQLLQRQGGLLDAADPLGDPVPHLAEQLQFQPYALLLGADDLLLGLLQFRGHVAFRPGQRLLADIAFRHLAQEALRHFDVVAEHLVVLDAQVPDAGGLPLLRLQVEDPLLAAGLRLPVFVQHRRISAPDDAALGDHHRRVRVDGPLQQVCQVLQGIQVLPDPDHLLALRVPQQVLHARDPLQAGAQRQAVPRVHVPVGDLVHQAFHVVYAFQFLGQGHAEHPVVYQFLHRVQPAVDLLFVQQWLFHPAAQQSAAHCGARLVDQAQQRALPAVAPQALRQFQVPPGVLVQQHRPAVLGKPQGPDMLQAVLLGLVQVAQQRARRAGGVLPVVQAQCRQLAQVEMLAQRLFRVPFLEPGLGLSAQAADLARRGGERRRIVADDFHRVHPGDLRPRHVQLRLHDVEFARGYVRVGDPGLFPVDIYAQQVVVRLVLQHGGIRHRTGGDDADHVPFHQAFGQRRILHLFADGDLVSLADQLFNVCIHGVIRHAAHRRPFLQAAVLACQCQFQLMGCCFRVLEKQLVEVSQPEQQQAVRIRVVDPEVLLHHG